MTIYNINKGIGWASSGVEYAQAYRSNVFKKNGQKAKFIFTDIFLENLEPMTKNLGFEDEEIIWLYQYFTDTKLSPTTYLLSKFIREFPMEPSKVEENESYITYFFEENQTVIRAFLDKNSKLQVVYKSEIIFQNNLIQRNYYSYTKIFSEYFKPVENRINLYQRRFFNEDGTVSYDEIINGYHSLYIFEDRTIYSFQNLFSYFMELLELTDRDILLIDRSTDIGPAVLKGRGPAKVGVIIHAEHFSESFTDDRYILWNNFYDYQFKNAKSIDFFISPTLKQKEIIEKQFEKYNKGSIKVYAIPVGSINSIKTSMDRKPTSLITASRLANEKHLDWVIEAVVNAQKTIKGLTLDIYGEGGERAKLESLIQKMKAQDFIKIKGQQNLKYVYENYETYISASTSEGFGLTLLEAIGSGLAMIGFDVMYGNPTFIKQDMNGYLVEYIKNNKKINIEKLSNAIINLYQLDEQKRDNFKNISYEISQIFLTENIQKMWQSLENEVIND